MYAAKSVNPSGDRVVNATMFGIKNPVHTPTTIWQLDWEGNPVAAYETGYHIANFTVDEATNHIYACVYKDDEQVLAVIDLNNK